MDGNHAPDRSGPWALVTGASSGIGAAFARALARRGYHLALVARRADRLEELLDRCRDETGVDGLALALDLTDADAVARIEDALGDRPLEFLVDNAGFGASAPFLECDPERIRAMVRLNCEAVALVARTFLPRIVARGRGALVVVASTAAYQSTPWMAVYGATKAFDLMLCEALAVELEGSAVDVLCVSPGHTRTEFHEVAGVDRPVLRGSSASAEQVVEATFRRLGRKHSFVHGFGNAATAFATRFAPRRLVARAAGRLLRRRLGD